jgi:hypothetical protein
VHQDGPLVQVLVLVVARVCLQEASESPLLRGRRGNPERVCDFVEREQAAIPEPLIAGLEVIVIPHAHHHHDVHGFARA